MDTNEIRLEAQDLNQQGALLLKAGNIEDAKIKFDKAIEKEPMLMDSYKNYGDLCMTIEDYKEAKAYYKKALLIEKKGFLHFLYGNACFMNDELHEGLESYNLAISTGYDSDEMLFFMGMAYEHMNDDHMALRYFQKACTKNPSCADYIIKKIGVLLRLNMIENAEQSVEELLLTAPEFYEGYHLKTQLLLQKNKIKEAIEFAKEASNRFPEDADLRYDYVRSVAYGHDFEKALQLIQNAKQMKYYENAKRAFTMLEAQISAEKNDYEMAVKCCKDCIELEKEDLLDKEARFMLMNLYLAKPDYEKSLEQAIVLSAKNTEDSYYFASLYYKPFCMKNLGKAEEAIAGYKEANAIYRLETLKHPEAIDVYLYRAMCLKDLEQYDKALEILDFVLGLSTEIAEVYTIKADIYKSMQMNKEAEEELQKAYLIKPELKPLDN